MAPADFQRQFQNFESGSVGLFVDKAVNPKPESELIVNVALSHYPLRYYCHMWNMMSSVVKKCEKVG